MTIDVLLKFVGKKVTIYFKGGEKGIYGKLGYNNGYFFIGNTTFKIIDIRKIIFN